MLAELPTVGGFANTNEDIDNNTIDNNNLDIRQPPLKSIQIYNTPIIILSHLH